MLPRLAHKDAELTDLHVHSHYSDGACSPVELARLAAARGLSAMALTDHAEVAGIPALTMAATKLGIYTIPGVELNSDNGDFLGLFIDDRDPGMRDFLARVRAARRARIERTLERLAALGLEVEINELSRLAHPGDPSRTTVAQALVAAGSFPDTDSVFRELLRRGRPAYEPADAPSAEECLRAIQVAGGVGIEAHPQFSHRSLDPADLDSYYRRIARLGVVGFENSAELPSAIGLSAEGHGLIPVGGSNYHGEGLTRARFGSPATPGSTLGRLVAALPDHSLHKHLFKRLRWRSRNLGEEEFAASLRPEPIVLSRLEGAHLLQRPPPPPDEPASGRALPFVLIGPGALDAEERVCHALAQQGARMLPSQTVAAYPELAWDLYALHRGNDLARRRDLLRYNLDRHLYGSRASTCRVAFFEPPGGTELWALKQVARSAVGPMRFYRLQAGEVIETCFTSFVHMPDEDRIDAETTILQRHGVSVPLRSTVS